MQKWILLIGLISVVGCTTSPTPRKPSSQDDAVTAVEGTNAETMREFLKSQGVNENCDGRTCEIQADNISCNIERSLPDAECSWKIIKSGSKKARTRSVSAKKSAELYNMLKNLGAVEDCDGRSCSIEVKSMGCFQERMLSLECGLTK